MASRLVIELVRIFGPIIASRLLGKTPSQGGSEVKPVPRKFLPNFAEKELRCKSSGLLILAPGFSQSLQGLRDALELHYLVEYGQVAKHMASMIITSACRSKEYNSKSFVDGGAGGHPRSLHVCDEPYYQTGGCCAVDVFAPSGETRNGFSYDEYRVVLAELAWDRGWSIGYHSRFLHLDMRTTYAGLTQAKFDY